MNSTLDPPNSLPSPCTPHSAQRQPRIYTVTLVIYAICWRIMVNHLRVQRGQPLGLMGFSICHTSRLRECFLVICWHLFVLYSQSPSMCFCFVVSSLSQFVVCCYRKRCRKDSSPQRASVGEVRFLFNGDFVDRGTWGPEAREFHGTFGWEV